MYKTDQLVLLIFEMPKDKQEKSSVLRGYVTEFGKNVFSTDGKILFCVPCEKVVSAEKNFQVNQHLSTGKHKSAVLRSERSKQPLVQPQLENQGKIFPFSFDLCTAFISHVIRCNVSL